MNTQPRVRTSDAEREEIVTVLRAAMGEGRLTLAEGEERIASAYAAIYRDELGPLTTDLPDGGREAVRRTPEGKAEMAAMARFHLARRAVFIGFVGTILITIWALSGGHFFWPAIPLAFLLLGLFRRAAWYRYGGGWGHHHYRHHRHYDRTH
jgi:hypothetical protein